MSCYVIFYENGAKMMRPVLTAAEYRNLRNSNYQKRLVTGIRKGDAKQKMRLLQMNYSCMPSNAAAGNAAAGNTAAGNAAAGNAAAGNAAAGNSAAGNAAASNAAAGNAAAGNAAAGNTAAGNAAAGNAATGNVTTPSLQKAPLKGCKSPSMSVGMDVDFDPSASDYEEMMEKAPEMVLSKKDELGLLMLERSARKGYHLVFRRHFMDGLAEGKILENQEINLKWASELLGVKFDEAAKDITRVFFSTTASEEDLLFLDDALFEQTAPNIENLAASGNSTVTSRGTVDEVSILIRKAFDNAEHGQERVGADSITGIAPLRWNFNASTTIPNAHRFFLKSVNDGTLSRLNLSTIIKPRLEDAQENSQASSQQSPDDSLPIFGIYDDKFAQDLKPYLDRLSSASGLIECPQALKLAKELTRENDKRASLYESEAYRILSYRANVIAYLKAMVLYVAQGYHWSEDIAEYVRWSEQMDLWCKMRFFGTQLEEEILQEVKQINASPQNLLSTLPDEFTYEQFLRHRQQQGKCGDGKNTLRTWKHRGYVVYDEITKTWHKK